MPLRISGDSPPVSDATHTTGMLSEKGRVFKDEMVLKILDITPEDEEWLRYTGCDDDDTTTAISSTHSLSDITSFKRLILCPAHGQALRPAASLIAIADGQLFKRAILQRHPADLRFAFFVALDDIVQALLIRLGRGIDIDLWSVRLPDVRVSSILIERLKWHTRLRPSLWWSGIFQRGLFAV